MRSRWFKDLSGCYLLLCPNATLKLIQNCIQVKQEITLYQSYSYHVFLCALANNKQFIYLFLHKSDFWQNWSGVSHYAIISRYYLWDMRLDQSTDYKLPREYTNGRFYTIRRSRPCGIGSFYFSSYTPPCSLHTWPPFCSTSSSSNRRSNNRMKITETIL